MGLYGFLYFPAFSGRLDVKKIPGSTDSGRIDCLFYLSALQENFNQSQVKKVSAGNLKRSQRHFFIDGNLNCDIPPDFPNTIFLH